MGMKERTRNVIIIKIGEFCSQNLGNEKGAGR
jgi:hypothetical protein